VQRERLQQRLVARAGLGPDRAGRLAVTVVADVAVVRVEQVLPRRDLRAGLVGAAADQDRRGPGPVDCAHHPNRADTSLELGAGSIRGDGLVPEVRQSAYRQRPRILGAAVPQRLPHPHLLSPVVAKTGSISRTPSHHQRVRRRVRAAYRDRSAAAPCLDLSAPPGLELVVLSGRVHV
jgi:hypothetical protein